LLAATAVPDNPTVRLAFVALLATVREPVAFPAAAGLKVTDTVTEPFGVRVTFDPPLTVNPLPLADTLLIATLAVPESVSVTVCTAEFPTVRLPKLTFVELACSCEDAATPVPVSAISIEELAALLSTESVPWALPAAFGAKLNDTVIDWFGVSVAGAPLVIVNPLPVTASPDTVTFPGPASVRTTVSDAGEPMVTFPKLMVVELAEREEGAGCPEVPPDCAMPQPLVPRIPASANRDNPHAKQRLAIPRASARDKCTVSCASIAILLGTSIFN